MNAKLTLTIERVIIERAKRYAKQNNRSLSDIIENYLKSITEVESNSEDKRLNPVVKSLKGSFKMPKDFNYQDELNKRRNQKYL